MFRSRARNRKIFSRRKRVRRFSWLSAIASIALFLILLELLTRIFVDLSGNRSRFARSAESKPIEAYKLNLVESDRPSTPDRAKETVTEAKPSDLQFLQIKNSIYTGYELVGDRNSQYWQINAQGFRDREPVPLAKPQNEVRIFLLGGSTAFGYGSSSNAATISAQLEQRLQERLQQQNASPQLYKPDVLPSNPKQRQKSADKPAKIKPGDYRVINAAVPGYASGNELAQVALEILKYDPDLIIVLDGYVDLVLSSQEKAVEISQIQQNNANRTDSNRFDRFIEPVKDRSYLIQVVRDRWANSQKTNNKADFILDERLFNLIEHLPGGEQELQNRVARYIENQRQILKISAAAKIPLIVAIQPEITGRNAAQLSDSEGQIATQLGRSYIRQVRNSYPAFIEATQELARSFPKNIKALDLYRLTDKYPSPSFIDPIHLNEAANEKLAEQLYYAISGFSKMQVVPKVAAPKPAAKPAREN